MDVDLELNGPHAVQLVSAITRRAAQELRLQPGSAVQCLIKTQSIECL
jgi:molybdopterin-binding protein